MATDGMTDRLPMTREERDAIYRDVMDRLDRIGERESPAANGSGRFHGEADREAVAGRRVGDFPDIPVQSFAVLLAALVVAMFDPVVAGILAVSALSVGLISRVRADHAS